MQHIEKARRRGEYHAVAGGRTRGVHGFRVFRSGNGWIAAAHCPNSLELNPRGPWFFGRTLQALDQALSKFSEER